MKSLTVGQLKSDFSDVLAAVQRGESITVEYGRKRKPVARIVPYEVTDQPRTLGILAESARCVWKSDEKISDEEFLES
jgi:prevent-host-death family protein